MRTVPDRDPCGEKSFAVVSADSCTSIGEFDAVYGRSVSVPGVNCLPRMLLDLSGESRDSR